MTARETGLPEAFVWSRFGVEAGEGVAAILRRKNMERRATGLFAWGIGSALGASVEQLVARTSTPILAFSPITGPAAAHDVAPTSVVAWRAYLDPVTGPQPLPAGVLVTSRGTSAQDNVKSRHYALFCETDDELALGDLGALDASTLRNLASGGRVGSSQVTATVTRGAPGETPGRIYPIALIVRLTPPYYARLADPVAVDPTAVAALQAIADAGDVDAWRTAVAVVRVA
jgi:hypothetical protein